MADERVKRRLAAILVADAVAYSRLMSEDEAGTRARFRAHLYELIEPAVKRQRGRVVKTTGDGLLAEFASVVDCLQCAVEIQDGMAERNADQPETQRIDFRVGVNLGDIIVEADDIFGDGVNIAARLEALADPGGICVSGDVHRQCRSKIDVDFEDLGTHDVKNIAEPLHVYRVRPRRGTSARMTAVPDRPSIAVLAFANMSGDPEQEYFADGIVDEIITQLARFPDLFVIARNSSFTYKGRPVKVQDVGRELGVAHVVEGSVRKAGKRVRITVQLIDAASGNHLWAERYERELVDIFELQDEITQAIVGVLPGRIESAAAARLKRKPPSDMAAYDYVLAGKIHHDRMTREDNIEALRLLDRAIALDPEFAAAWAWRACTLGQALAIGYPDDPRAVQRLAVEAIDRAFDLDANDVNCHRLLCEVHMEEHRLDQAALHHEKAFHLNPNDVLIVAQRGELLTWQGRHEEGAEWIDRAMRLDPFTAHRRAHLLGRALHGARRYGAALDAFKRIRSPRPSHIADMAACYARLGDSDAAAERAAEVSRTAPGFSSEAYVAALPYREGADRAHHLEGLLIAGMPK